MSSTTFVLTRDDCQPTHTFGTFVCPDGWTCQTLEDTVREAGVKIHGETAIPSGSYRLTITKSQRFQVMMPLVNDVPMFTGIRIHAGNTTKMTSGCILVGLSRGTQKDGSAWLAQSRDALAEVQRRIAVAITTAGMATLDILTPRVTTTQEFRLDVEKETP